MRFRRHGGSRCWMRLAKGASNTSSCTASATHRSGGRSSSNGKKSFRSMRDVTSVIPSPSTTQLTRQYTVTMDDSNESRTIPTHKGHPPPAISRRLESHLLFVSCRTNGGGKGGVWDGVEDSVCIRPPYAYLAFLLVPLPRLKKKINENQKYFVLN